MLWRVRASLQDRPGAMAALATRCGDQDVNILGLQIFPTTRGVIDELVLHTPDGWTALDVEAMVRLAGARDPQVAECTPRALEDQAVRYARAAQAVMERPETLEEQLCRLLDASPRDASHGLETLVLDDGVGPTIDLQRRAPFTDTEHARAAVVRQVAAESTAVPAYEDRSSPSGSAPTRIRRGSVDDAARLVAMHARCSAETVLRRYHAPMPYLPLRLARDLIQPEHGWSVVMTSGEDLVGVAMVARDGDGGNDVGLLVEDRWQRHGIGARLLHVLAREAVDEGLSTLKCVAQPSNQVVLATIRRAGLRAHVTMVGGVVHAIIPIATLVEAPGVCGGEPTMTELASAT